MRFEAEVRRGEGTDSKRDWTEAQEALGYLAYPGTLNVKLNEPFPMQDGVTIFDFFSCTPATIGGIRGHLCTIKESGSPRQGFLVAPVRLRDALKLKHKSKVEVIV